MKKDHKKPWEVYKNSKKDSVDLNFQDATYHLKNIIECQERIKDLESKDSILNYLFKISSRKVSSANIMILKSHGVQFFISQHPKRLYQQKRAEL